MNNGWIKLHRKFTKWEWYTDVPVKVLFLHLLLKANHEGERWKGREVERGQCVVGRHKLAEETGLSERQIRTALDKLKNTGEIRTESTNKFTLITVVNYALYQEYDIDERPTNGQQLTNNRPTTDQQATTNKNKKNEKNEKNKRNIFVKPSFDEVAAYINENMFNVKPDVFYDYYEANGWMVGNKKMKDWKATVRNWDRRENTPKQKPKQEGWAF